MFIEMSCSCSASFQGESDNDTLLQLWGQSFIAAHQDCGYMAKQYSEEEEKMKRYDISSKEKREKEL
jgi:hypothetical protein